MAAPTQPTPTLIVTEAYRQFGLTASAAQITTAIAEGIEKVKRDIWALGKRFKLLRTIQYKALKVGVSRYANPSDFEADVEGPGMSLLDGNSRSTLQGAAAGTATLAAAEGASQSQAEGHLLMITSGTGINQAEQIDDYDTSTKVATMRANWGTTPAAADAYLLVDSHYPVWKKAWPRRANYIQPMLAGKPREAFEMAGGSEGFIELYPVPDKVYGLKRDYYANLTLVDTSSDLYNVIMRNWAGVFTQGILVWIMASYDDTRRRTEEEIYRGMLKQLQANELDYHQQSNLQQKVID